MVVATTTIVADLVKSVGGGDVDVVSLMGAGVDPHVYKPSAGDVRRMAAADIVFYSGLHLEGKMGDVLEKLNGRGVRTVAVADCIPEDRLIETSAFGAGGHDPHVWFDVALWRSAIDCVEEGLAEVDPVHLDDYRSRADVLAAELKALDLEITERLAAIPPGRRVLVTAHDAFAYFGRAYGLEVRGLLGVSTASEAGAADVTALAKYIAERKIPAVFVETSVSPRTIEALREAVASRGFEVARGGSLYSDALGSPGTPAETYAGTVRANVETIVSALGGKP
jgi:manganese/zinc/iron transport system substrate-binding protein